MTTEELIDRGKVNDTRKAELLSNPVEHVDITSYDARPIIDAMRKMSFTSRDTARAADISTDARGPGLLDHPGRSPARPPPAAACTSTATW